MPELSLNGLRFEEAAKFFRDKVRLPTEAWTDLKEGMHTRAFVVAGAMQDGLLKDLQAAVQSAIDNGTGIEDFRARFDETVAKHGWTYKGGRNWRTRVIFETNLRTAAMAGRWEQIQRVKDRRPWLRYVAVLDERTRPDHRRWHGTVLKVDDDWWKTHYPPNDWMCRCTVMNLSDRQMRDFGYAPSEEPPPIEPVKQRDPFTGGEVALDRGIGPGWNYNVGEAASGNRLADEVMASWRKLGRDAYEPLSGGAYRQDTPASLSLPPSLPVRQGPAPLERLRNGEQEKLARLVKRVIAGDTTAFKAPDGSVVVVDAEAFAGHVQANRSPFLGALPQILTEPEEIWWSFERHKGTGRVELRRRYLARLIFGDDRREMLIVAQANRGWLEAWTLIPMESETRLDSWRFGRLAWSRVLNGEK